MVKREVNIDEGFHFFQIRNSCFTKEVTRLTNTFAGINDYSS